MASYKPAFIYGGTIVSGSALCEALTKINEGIQVFATTANGENELPVTVNKITKVDDVNVIYFKRLTKDHSHFSPALLKAVWKQAASFDIIHIHAWWNTVSVLSALIALLKRVPVVISPRGMLSNYSFNNRNVSYKKIIHSFLGKPLLNRSYIHTTSNYEHTALANLINPPGFYNIPNFIKLPTYQPDIKQKSSDVFKLLFLSRIEEKKGLDILFGALTKIDIPYHLTIAGTGEPNYIASLKQLAEGYNLTNYITWIGFQKESKFNLLAQHDVMVLPSYDENFGNVVIESLSVGTAVLLSDKVGLASFVKENELGWVCATNTTAIATTIHKIFNTPADLKRITTTAPPIIAANFSETKLVQQYIEMYQTIIKK